MKLILLNIIPILAFVHPFHISVTEMEYNKKSKSLQIVSRIFIDDLETAMRESLHRPDLTILESDEERTSHILIADYLTRRLRVTINGKDSTIEFLGYEQDGLALLCYLEIEHIRNINRIEITNATITDAYDDQSNLVHVTYQEEIKSLRLTKDNLSGVLVF